MKGAAVGQSAQAVGQAQSFQPFDETKADPADHDGCRDIGKHGADQ